MGKQNIAIVGLGRVGSVFLDGVMLKASNGINILCAAEKMDTPGKAKASAAGIKIVSLDDVIKLGEEIDVIFDLTGLVAVRKELREKLVASKNHHTVIAPEIIVHVIWSLISAEALPVIEGRETGY